MASPRRAATSNPGASRLLLGIVSTVTWMFFSSALIILNNNLYKMGFQRPFFVTGCGQLFSLLGGLAMVGTGMLPLQKLPSKR